MSNVHIILLVDDDPDDLELLQNVLKDIEPGYEIVIAENGLIALEKLTTLYRETAKLPCIIVLDINMPRMDGRETFLELKSNEHFSKIPVVIFSTSFHPNDKLFFSGENVYYMVKPVSFDDLFGIAKKVLGICSHRSS